jgi:hypothetical protein
VLDHRQFGRVFVLSIGEAGHEATTAPGSSGAWWRSPASGPRRRRDSAPAADRACRGSVRLSGYSITGSSAGPSFSRSVKPATKRQRRQGRTVPGGDRRQAVPGRRRDSVPAADRACRGLLRLSGLLDHRQFGRVFVLSISEAGHEATTAPGSSGAWWRSPASGPRRRRDSVPAADRACRGLLRLSGCSQASVAGVRQGCLRRGPCWRCSIIGSSAGASPSRSVKPATKRQRRQRRAVPGGDRRQVGHGEGGTAYRLPIGVAVACGCGVGVRAIRGCLRRGPCWRCSITGSSSGLSSSRSVKPPTKRRRRQRRAVPGGDRRQVGQGEGEKRTGGRSVVPWRWAGQALGVRAIRGCRRRGPCWRCSITGNSSGPSSSRSVKPATKRRRRQGRAVPGGDRRQGCQGERGTAYRLPIGVAVAWSGSRGAGNPRLPLAWPVLAALDHRQFGRAFVLSIGEAGHEATTAPASSGAWWRSPARVPRRTRDSATAADRSCRGLVRLSGCGQSAVAAGVARAGSARSQAVRQGLRPLDR